jgi:hypothetical protein
MLSSVDAAMQVRYGVVSCGTALRRYWGLYNNGQVRSIFSRRKGHGLGRLGGADQPNLGVGLSVFWAAMQASHLHLLNDDRIRDALRHTGHYLDSEIR